MKYILPVLVAMVVSLLAASPAGAALNPANPNTYIYGDNFIGPDGNGTSPIWFAGVQIDFDGYVGARPGETFTIHMFNNNTDGSTHIGSYRTGFSFDPALTERGIVRTGPSNTAGTFDSWRNAEWLYPTSSVQDWYHGMNSQADIWEGLCVISYEFTVLDTAPVGSTTTIGLEFRAWTPAYAGEWEIWWYGANYGALTLEILPPLPDPPDPPDPGDFDDDGDVDTNDIDDLCANMTGDGVPAIDAKYDLDGDGDTDSADMDILIHDLVEITGGDGTGTEYADFDLNGEVNTTDLTILATNFGIGTTWAEGNANCDTVINTTDLTIMATNFGFVAAGAVPEPATMSLLGIGGIAALIRRRRSVK